MDSSDTPDLQPAHIANNKLAADENSSANGRAEQAVIEGESTAGESGANIASKTRRDAGQDPLAARNKRLFGALFVGTLKQAKSRLDSSEDKQRLERQSAAQEEAVRKEARAKEAAEAERRRHAQDVAEARAKEAAARREAQAEQEAAAAQERAERSLRVRLLDATTASAVLCAHEQEVGRVTYPGPSTAKGEGASSSSGPRYTHGFLLTRASPPLYWSPYKHNGDSKRSGKALGQAASARIQEVHEEMQARVEQVRKEVEEEVAELRARAGRKRGRRAASSSSRGQGGEEGGTALHAASARGDGPQSGEEGGRQARVEADVQAEEQTVSEAVAGEEGSRPGMEAKEEEQETGTSLPPPPPPPPPPVSTALGEGEVMLDYE